MTYQEAMGRLNSIAIDCVGELATSENKVLELTIEAIDLAIEALEKQIPKKPKEIENGWLYFYCPHCGNLVGTLMNFQYPTCVCGQRLDWSGRKL